MRAERIQTVALACWTALSVCTAPLQAEASTLCADGRGVQTLAMKPEDQGIDQHQRQDGGQEHGAAAVAAAEEANNTTADAVPAPTVRGMPIGTTALAIVVLSLSSAGSATALWAARP